MKRDRLCINQLLNDAFAWYFGYLGAMDARPGRLRPVPG